MGFNPGGSGGIAGASDVALSGVQDNEVLTYDSASSKWQNDESSPSGDVRDLSLSGDVISADATNWVAIPSLAFDDAATGQVWIINYTLLVDTSIAAGITFRFRNGNGTSGLVNPTSHTIFGYYQGIDIVTTPTNSAHFTKTEIVRYPASTALYGAFGGVGNATPSVCKGEFRVQIAGSGLTDQTIGLEFHQRVLDAGNSSRVLAGSFATAARAA